MLRILVSYATFQVALTASDPEGHPSRLLHGIRLPLISSPAELDMSAIRARV